MRQSRASRHPTFAGQSGSIVRIDLHGLTPAEPVGMDVRRIHTCSDPAPYRPGQYACELMLAVG